MLPKVYKNMNITVNDSTSTEGYGSEANNVLLIN